MNNYSESALWRIPVEKFVENVENLGFSTGISLLCKRCAPMYNPAHKPVAEEMKVALCCRRSQGKFKEKPAKKLDSRQNSPWSPDAISRKRGNFCEKAPNTVPYDFTSRGNT